MLTSFYNRSKGESHNVRQATFFILNEQTTINEGSKEVKKGNKAAVIKE